MARTKKTVKKATFTRKKKAPKKAPKKPPIKALPAASADAPPAAGEKKQTKTSFVLSFPPDVPAKEVVAKGAEQGISLTEKGVYKTRFLARSKLKKAGQKAVKKTPPKAASKKAPKAQTKGKRGPGDGSGSAFVRAQPTSMKAGEVVAAAAAKGISITPGLVYSVRAAAKKAGAKATKSPASSTGKRRGRPPAAAAKAASQVVVGGDREKQLIQLALDLGLSRSVELIEGIRAKINSLV